MTPARWTRSGEGSTWVVAGSASGPGCGGCAYMMVSTGVVRCLPRQRRLLGLAMTAGGLALDRIVGPSEVAPWFAWTYYPKLLLGHAAASLWSEADLAPADPGVLSMQG